VTICGCGSSVPIFRQYRKAELNISAGSEEIDHDWRSLLLTETEPQNNVRTANDTGPLRKAARRVRAITEARLPSLLFDKKRYIRYQLKKQGKFTKL
jgi:hypothetical protein